MGMLGMHGWDDDGPPDEDDGPMIGGSERREERMAKWVRAKEIASGLVMGTFERDEEVLEFVRKIQSDSM